MPLDPKWLESARATDDRGNRRAPDAKLAEYISSRDPAFREKLMQARKKGLSVKGDDGSPIPLETAVLNFEAYGTTRGNGQAQKARPPDLADVLDGAPHQIPGAFSYDEQQKQQAENPWMTFAQPLKQLFNVIPSGVNLVKNTVKAGVNVLNPDPEQNTVVQLGKVGLGAGIKAIEGVSGQDLFDDPLGAETAAERVGESLKQRYGSPEAFSRTMFEDPVGFISDLDIALAPFGGLAKVTDKISQKAGSVGPAGLFPTKAPAAAAKDAGKAVRPNLFQKKAQDLYQSALKPTKRVVDEFPEVVQTGLKNRVILTKGSLPEVQSMLEDLWGTIDDKIDEASGAKVNMDDLAKKYGSADDIPLSEIDKAEAMRVAGAGVKTEDVLKRMDRAKGFFKNTPGGSKLAEHLDELADTFRKEQGEVIPLATAQKLKKNTYQLLKNSYGELSTAVKEGYKDIARGLKEEIVTKVPELKKLNVQGKQLIGLEKALEDFARRSGNRQVLDLGSGVGSVVGGALQGAKGALKGIITGKLLKMALDDPTVKSAVAIILDRLSSSQGAARAARTATKAAVTTSRASRLLPPEE